MLIIHQPGQEVLLQIVQGGQLYFSRRTRGLNNLHLLNAQDSRSDMLERLLLELQRSMDYFESQLKQAPVRDIRILAQQPDLLCKLLTENGFVRVEPLAPPLQLGAYSDEFVQCWPAIAATVVREAQS
jgi:MSHA biogenesis protein MshI